MISNSRVSNHNGIQSGPFSLLAGSSFAVSCQVAIRGESRAIRVLLECIMWLLHLFKDLKMASMMERMGISASASHLFQYREF